MKLSASGSAIRNPRRRACADSSLSPRRAAHHRRFTAAALLPADAPAADVGAVSRRTLLGGALSSVAVLPALAFIAPAPAKAADPGIINDPAVLRAQLEAQYAQWAAGQYDAWLAGQPETIKVVSTYNGSKLKLKGKAGARQYFATLTADLDIRSYKPLAIFVDNDGDEATVVVETSGTSRRTRKPFSTIFLHSYTIGPNFQILKFKEQTDTALLAELAPPSPAAEAATAGVQDAAPVPPGGAAPLAPGSAARQV